VSEKNQDDTLPQHTDEEENEETHIPEYIPTKKIMGRPKIKFEDMKSDAWDILEALIPWAGAEYIALYLGVSVDTLDRRLKEKHGVTFAEYKKICKSPVKINLRMKQYEVAMKGNVAMLQWLGKNELNQADKVKTENTHTVETLEQHLRRKQQEKLNGQEEKPSEGSPIESEGS